jgi:hypothetical protein
MQELGAHKGDALGAASKMEEDRGVYVYVCTFVWLEQMQAHVIHIGRVGQNRIRRIIGIYTLRYYTVFF